jgi:microsomal dipeptidase-like Zn-dependent dipeptidase
MDLRSIADLQSLAGSLGEKGYSAADVEAVFSGNWLRKLREVLG